MERFVTIVNGSQLLTLITKCSILDVTAALDPPLNLYIFSKYIEVIRKILLWSVQVLAPLNFEHIYDMFQCFYHMIFLT